MAQVKDYSDMVSGCRKGDRRAQKALYETFAPMALGVCMRFAADRDAAQDLMQDGFIRVFEHIGKLREPSSLGAWIYRTMVNVCLRNYRKHQREVIEQDDTSDAPVAPLDPFGMEELVWAMQQLPPAQRTAFNLTEIEGYSYSEVASEMHCTEVNLRALVCRAKATMRKLLTNK